MAERDLLLAELVTNILGPRGGSQEVLPPNKEPLNEYITGVLAPRVAVFTPQMEQTEELEGESTDSEDDSPDFAVPPPTVVPGMFSPTLDPRARPRAMGLSFIVEAADEPSIEVCATWARYGRDAPGSWQRRPEHLLIPALVVDRDHPPFDSGTDVRVVVRSRSLPSNRWRVSIHLINMRVATRERPTTEDHVFQPQIRVCCVGVSMPVQLDAEPGDDTPDDDRSMWLLYRGRPALGRGHLCGVTWRAIDPEGPCAGETPPALPPFVWVDADIVPVPDRARFASPDLRTEFVPTYSIVAPDMTWPRGYGTPELDPAVLAECWDRTSMRVALEPLVDGYERWVADQERSARAEIPISRGVAEQNARMCRAAVTRMREGMERICNSQEVQLAFCFANRAIALQARWHDPGRPQTWRPFQLAFILMNVPSVADPQNADRNVCDLLWVPTGGGKTEAYLGLAAFAMAHRRLVAPRDSDGHRMGEGVTVLSRYTLRLLTIQQYRRALRLVTACEYLRLLPVNGHIGWRPARSLSRVDFLWGGARFCIGLWVGGGVTPNSLASGGGRDSSGGVWWFQGALDNLQDTPTPPGVHKFRTTAEPAQVLTCPSCRTVLAIPASGLSRGTHTLHWVIRLRSSVALPPPPALSDPTFTVTNARLTPLAALTYYTLSVTFDVASASVRDVDTWWRDVIQPSLGASAGAEIAAARASRPGYFIRYIRTNRGEKASDFEVVCPNPDTCDLNQITWAEKVPVLANATTQTRADRSFQEVLEPFQVPGTSRQRASRVPIPAATVDDQVYRRCPSMVIATADKFARLAFEGEAATLFGNVEFYHPESGFYRQFCPPVDPGTTPGHPPRPALAKPVGPFDPPSLIIQDELHLIEGPLGSMVGLYETAVAKLCERFPEQGIVRPKYIASTATVRRAEEQVQSIFDRSVAYFPPPGMSIGDSFFVRSGEAHALDSRRAGRLYVGVCAQGWGALTPIVRVWSSLLQAVWERQQAGASSNDLDPFWTLVGYFNAIRELAGAVALYRQDIQQWLQVIARTTPRPLPQEDPTELSSRDLDATRLPALLERLDARLPDALDAVVATSMFGTGVDVSRLGLMVVHGQPKTTSAYIQATGRVGRSAGALVVTMFRAARVRDLAHYEFFTSYHRQLHRYVEPITVAPFAPRARERALGPLSVALLRQASTLDRVGVDVEWRDERGARRMAGHRNDTEVRYLPDVFELRANTQPLNRQPPVGATAAECDAELDRWSQLASSLGSQPLVYHESSMLRAPRSSVVLGDPAHQRQVPVVVFENAPNSLREVEATTTFQTK